MATPNTKVSIREPRALKLVLFENNLRKMVKAPKLHLTSNKKKAKVQNGETVGKTAIEKPKTIKVKTQKPNKKGVPKIAKTVKANVTAALGKNAVEIPKKKKNLKPKVKPATPPASPQKNAEVGRKLPSFEPVVVEEDTFDAVVNLEQVTKIATALKTLVEGQVAKQKKSIFEDYSYCLNVACFKIPSCPKRMVKVNLKHALVNLADDDIVLVVPDLKRGAKVEHDSTIEHYTDLLREAGVEGLTIMPFNQLRNEYKTFEAKNKLASTFDYYLCDGRIVGQVSGFCGTIFQKPRTTFHSVRLDRPKAIKTEIEKSLRRSAYKQLHKGDLITIIIGNDKFSSEKVAENVMHVIKELKSTYPGGISNIRGIDLKINIVGTSSLPIYVCTSEGPQEAPYVVGPREQHMLDLKKEANSVLLKFNLTKDGEIKRLSKEQVERKLKLKEARAELLTETSNEKNDDESVPAKKAKILEENNQQKPAKKEKKQQKPAALEKPQTTQIKKKQSKSKVNEVKPSKAPANANKKPEAAKPIKKDKPLKPVKEKKQPKTETAKTTKKVKKVQN